ncbi:MAG: fimbrillin family protein [Lachnospiraceae bacterium]
MSADTRVQSGQKAFDFLWAQATGSKANPNVAFTFAHKMAKVVITVKKGADVSFEEVKTVKLSLNGFLHDFNTNHPA